MKNPPRMTLTTLLTLRALLADPGREMYGREIMQSSRLSHGAIYPVLIRMEAAGWVSARDEVIDKHAEGRPARRYYRLTPKGIEEAGSAVARASARLSALDPPPLVPPLRIGGIEIPILVDDRQPPGVVSVVSAGLDRDGKVTADAAHMVNIGADEPEPGPCEHRIPPGSYCTRCERLIGGLRLAHGLSPAAAPQPAAHLPQAAKPVDNGGQAPGPCRRRAVLGVRAGCRVARPRRLGRDRP